MAKEETALPYQKIKGMAPGFIGFHLAILKLEGEGTWLRIQTESSIL